jgi:tRNA(Ser,Leu) C12 N-acetylase TAN1
MREYSMDLSFSINTLSWRKFELLLDNLSIKSNIVNMIQARKEGKSAVVSTKQRGNSIINQFL